ncbi:MAG: MATE family efflux transporter [Longibaculum sp.]
MFHLKVDLLKDNILKALLIFALPILIANIFQQLYNTMDTMIVGNFLGDTSLAAISACGAVYELLIGFALGVGNGLSIVTARSYGAHDEKLIKKSVAGSIVIGIGLTLLIMLISVLFLYPLLELLHTPANIIDEAYSYIATVTLFVGVMFAYNLCAGLLRAIGNSVMPLIFLIISSLINVGLDLLLITQFSLGVQGAAIATVISQGISVILCFLYIYQKTPILIPQKEHFQIDIDLYKELLGQGFSMGFMMSIVSAGTVILQSSINGFGYLIIAGHGTARKLNSFCMMPAGTIGLALSTFVSQNKGANQQKRIRDGVRYGNLIACGWGVIITIILFFGAPWLVKLISGSHQATVVDNASLYLRVNAPFYAVLGILLNLRNSLQGLGMKIIPLVSSVIECLGKVVFVALFIPVLGYFGVIICEPVIWCCMCLQLAYSFYRNPYIREAKTL